MPIQGYTGFFLEFLRHPGTVGAVAPSSRHLARHTVGAIDWQPVEAVVEFGPGTGAITEAILERKPADMPFIAIERNPRFVSVLQERFPTVCVVEDSVANVRAVCEAQGLSEVGAVISGLPWSSFSDVDQTTFLEALVSVLGPKGQFATYVYLTGLPLPSAWRFREKLGKYFRTVRRTEVIWFNMPPAFVYHCSV